MARSTGEDQRDEATFGTLVETSASRVFLSKEQLETLIEVGRDGGLEYLCIPGVIELTFRETKAEATEILPAQRPEPEHEPKHRYDLPDDDPVFDAVG